MLIFTVMLYKIPLFDLNFDENELKAVVDTIKSKWISMGPKTEEFESKFANMLNVKYAIALSNCTVALHLALLLLDIKNDDEVICPSLTFVATVNAIRYVGAIPVFVDINSFDDLTMDPKDIKRKINKRTKAIIVMHYGGFACNMREILDISKDKNIKIIEDASHSPFSLFDGQYLGTIGDIGCFSFFSNKNISTGEGGMLITKNPDYYYKAKLMRSHGMTTMSYDRAKGHSTSYDVVSLGYNYRLDDIRASIGIVQLDKVINDINERNKIRKLYIDALSSIDKINIPFKNYSQFSSNYIFPILIKETNKLKYRDYIRAKLSEAGIQTSVHYPAVHRFSIYKKFYTYLPKTDYVSDNLISLPMYSKLTVEEINYIADILYKVLDN